MTEPLKFTVPLLLTKLPVVCDQVPDTLKVVEGAVNVPVKSDTLLVVTVPVEPVKAPLLMVKPPLNVCVAVDAKYVPPDIVVSNVTLLVRPLALYVPLVTVKAPLIVTAPVGSHVPLIPLKTRL